MILPTKIGLKLSARRKLPVILAFDGEFWPHEFASYLWRARNWKRIEENSKYGIYKIGEQRMKLLRTKNKDYRIPSYVQGFFTEWNRWKRQYEPPFNLKGKTVLDAGSGCGETAFHFFKWGAKRVICVDRNPLACGVMEENAEANGWDAVVLCEPFNEEHMNLPFEFAKIDVEGGESCLLSLQELPPKPMVAEVHSAYLIKEFTERFGFHHHEILRKDDGIPAYSIMRCNY
jgi:SAM-dependent methyltransferase